MARRRTSTSYAAPGRSALTSRQFDDSIHQLTADSIEQSLREIEKVLQQRYGRHKAAKKDAEADAHAEG